MGEIETDEEYGARRKEELAEELKVRVEAAELRKANREQLEADLREEYERDARDELRARDLEEFDEEGDDEE